MASFFGGGMPGGPGGGGMVKDKKFYDLLEVDPKATSADIKKAYRRIAVKGGKKAHPDKGGDPEIFKEITKAYEVLSDPDKRKHYDRMGEEGLEHSGGSGFGGDFFGNFFGQGMNVRSKTKDVERQFPCTLEQLFAGFLKTEVIERNLIDEIKGFTQCPECGGTGVKEENVRSGNMISQMRSSCSACSGQGKTFEHKVSREEVEVHVPKGSSHGEKIKFQEMANEHPDADSGDVVFIIEELPHAVFKRKGFDLFIERKISLSEALCGFETELVHLDGRRLLVKTLPGEIIKPMAPGFDPMAGADDKKMEWDFVMGYDCADLETLGHHDSTDVNTLKGVIEKQMKPKGFDVGAFVINGDRAYFKRGTYQQVMRAKKPSPGTAMYVLADPGAKRKIKAVRGEGMPTYKNPFTHGNLFFNFTIEFPNPMPPDVRALLGANHEFPDELPPDLQTQLRAQLPPPLCASGISEDDPGINEVCVMINLDPVQSAEDGKVHAKDPDPEDEKKEFVPPGNCQQM